MNESKVGVPRTGVWQVSTETSVYLLDLDARRVTRVPDAGAGPPPGLTALPISSLRGDHQSVPLLELISCAMRRPMRMLIDLRRDGICTLRTTTVVRQLRELTADDRLVRDQGIR
jgi:hypothetical protein